MHVLPVHIDLSVIFQVFKLDHLIFVTGKDLLHTWLPLCTYVQTRACMQFFVHSLHCYPIPLN
jgi:hypothetical protein